MTRLAWWYLLGVPGVALALAVACRRRRVLLWLGGLIAIPAGSFVLWLRLVHWQADGSFFAGVCEAVATPLLAAGLIMLVGGLMRWGQARRGRRSVTPS
jgi:hypothetical protein